MDVLKVKKVGANGHIAGLKSLAGREVFVIPRPRVAPPPSVAKALETPRAMLSEIRRYAGEHRDLSARQLKEFTGTYGNPADRVKKYAKTLGPEEFRRRLQELESLVQKRVGEIGREVERRYEALETEVDETVDRLFRREAEARAAEPEPAPAPKKRASPKKAAASATGSSPSGERAAAASG
jgi:hypothetical protein